MQSCGVKLSFFLKQQQLVEVRGSTQYQCLWESHDFPPHTEQDVLELAQTQGRRTDVWEQPRQRKQSAKRLDRETETGLFTENGQRVGRVREGKRTNENQVQVDEGLS